MGEKLKPKFKADFDLLPEGLYIFRTDKATVEKTEKESEKLFKVESLVEGGDHDGGRAFDNFPLISKKGFGLERMMGFLLKLGALKAEKILDAEGNFDSDIFRSPKFDENFQVSVPGKLFGGRIKHNKAKESGNLMANIVEYYTVKEVEEEMKKPTTKKEKGKEKEKEPSEDLFGGGDF